MAIAMVAMLAFGGTYAYFTDKATEGMSFDNATTGTIKLGAGTKFSSTTTLQNVVPTESIFGNEDGITLTVEDLSNRAAYIFIEFNVVAEGVTGDQLDELTIVGLTNGMDVAAQKWDSTQSKYVDDTKVQLQSGSVTDGEGTKTVYYILTQDNTERNLPKRTYTIKGLNATLTADADNTWQGKTITITASVEIIQATGVDLQKAYDAQK